MLNKAIIIGRLTKDPEGRRLPNGTPVTSFTLGVDRNFKDRDGNKGADFIPVVAWSKTAELCTKYLSKGRQVAVCGRIQTRSYEAKDGTKRYVTEVVAEEVAFLGDNPNKKAQEDSFEQYLDDDFTEFDDSDAPF